MITGLKGRVASFLASLLAVLLLAAAPMAQAQEASSSQTAWRLLDYLSVDYAGAVKDGKIISPSEYAEMNEFAGQVRERIAGLPATKAQPDLLAKAESLQATIAAKQEPAVVSAKAHALANDLLADEGVSGGSVGRSIAMAEGAARLPSAQARGPAN